MKLTTSIAVFALAGLLGGVVSPAVLAQPMAGANDNPYGRPFAGAFFAGVGGGLAAHDNGAFSNRLRSYTPADADGTALLYQTSEFQGSGTTLNAHAGLMFNGRFVITATGERVTYPAMHSVNPPGTPRDEYNLSAVGGGLDLGYTVVNEGGMLVYPFGHVGYYQYSLDYTNNQSQPVRFFESDPVPSGATAEYTGAAPRWALGVGLVKILGADGHGSGGGFSIGARLAWGMMFSRPSWAEPDGSAVTNGGLTPGYNGVTLSVSIGGAWGWL